jgi:nucleoid-associated protein
VALQALSRHVDEDAPDALLNFVSEKFEEAPPELYADRNQLKRYTRLYGRDQDLSISFSTAMLGNHITYDESAGTLTIRAIPKSLHAQLARHKKKGRHT